MSDFANDADFEAPTPADLLTEAGLSGRAISEILRDRAGAEQE